MINIIVAHDSNRLIGCGGKVLPWHIPEDINLFKEKTNGNAVLMGRKTWDSIPLKYRPLSNRYNLIITSHSEKMSIENPPIDKYGPFFFPDINSAINGFYKKHNEDIYVIGGATIYKQAIDMKLVDKVILSLVRGSYDGDTFFPTLSDVDWDGKFIKDYSKFELWEFDFKGKR